MINENKFWEIIEKNKDNPLKFKEETKNMSISDMFEFFMLIEEKEKEFRLYEDKTISNCWHDLYEQGIYELSPDEIMFRGKEFYDAFTSCNKNKILDILFKNPNWKEPTMTVNAIYDIYALKVANEDELKNFDDDVVKYYCYLKFWHEVNKLGLNGKNVVYCPPNLDELEKKRKYIESTRYQPSELYSKALDIKKEIVKVFKQYVPLYRQLCNREITKEDFINKLTSQLKTKHGVELQELNNLWKVVNEHTKVGYKSDEIYAISNIIHLLIMDLFFPQGKIFPEEDSNNIDTFIYYKNK